MAKLQRGTNDLATVNSKLAKQWHPYKNGELTPRDVTAGSNKKVWWLGNCGHEWPAEIYSRQAGKGCPYCSNVKVLPTFNDIFTVKSELRDEWNWEKNAGIDPESILAGSHTHVWWKCKEGHEWPAEVRMRVERGYGCPVCAKRKKGITFRRNLIASGKKTFAEEYPEIAKEWHPTLNDPYLPSDYTSGSKDDIWWKCKYCDYEWQATIANRVYHKTGCPVCAGSIVVPGINDLQTKNSALAAEWHPTKNLPKTPRMVGPSSGDNVWWICKYGHEYQCRVADRQKGVGCSECSKRFRTSLPEKTVEYYIKQSFPNIISNYRPDFLMGSEIDTYIPDIASGVEYDGHRYHHDVERDKKKDALCTKNGIRLIRIREQKCPSYVRTDPTIILKDQNDDTFSGAIVTLMALLGGDKSDIDISRDKQLIIESFRNTAISGSIAEKYPDLAAEWHPTMNGELGPENIPATKSKDEYYWKCSNSKCGYSWKAKLQERINGTGCPACAGKVIIPGYNDLAKTHPDLAKEWYYERNDKTPQEVSKGQNDLVWWKCKNGHAWQARIKKRVAGSGCEECARKAKAEKQYRKVYQFSKDGKLVNEYPSARIAAKELGTSRSLIQHVCCGTGRNKTAGGFYWSYYEDGRVEPNERQRTEKRVLQYKKDGTFIKEYENVKIAAKEVGISVESIYHACNGTHGRKTAKGFIWRFKETDN